MVTHINSFAFEGIDVLDVDVQAHMSSGLPNFTIVGLADKAVAESRERVRAALGSLGLSLPPERITINLSPADLQKEGSHFDLPIALALLSFMDVIPEDELARYAVLGELSLDGVLTPVNGILPAALGASARGLGIICPEAGGPEAVWAGEDIDVLAPKSLLALINHFKGTAILPRPKTQNIEESQHTKDLRDIKGQETAKRALEIAAAGGHNLLMAGPPGSGKSMLAACLPGIMPPLTPEEMLEISVIRSVAGELTGATISTHRPFRDPHHNCSMAAMTGGGSKAKPGEVTLAHHGILFMDELPEFSRQVLESLRQPMETRQITVARAQAHITYPANFQLITAMNPCKCGYLDDASRACNKAPRCASDYQSRLSGPFLDRIDLHIDVPAVKPGDIRGESAAESSSSVAKRVQAARALQRKRYENQPVRLNAQADGEQLVAITQLDPETETLLLHSVDKMGLSMRGFNRVLRVARTIADLTGSETVTKAHITEALGYRPLSYKQPAAA